MSNDNLPEVEDLNVVHPDDIKKLDEKVKELLEKFDLSIKFNLKPKAACAANCTCFGPGLENGEVDIPSEFAIKTADNQGRPLEHGDNPINVKIISPSGKEVPATLNDNHDGSYKVNYVPVEDGKHKIVVAVDDKPIKGCPTDVSIDPPTPDPSKCSAEGPGLENANVGVEAPFVITARNKAGMPLKVGGHDFAAELVGPFEAVVKAKVVDNNNGTYNASYVAKAPGKAKVSVTVLAGKPIAQSPFNVSIDKNQTDADASKCYAFGPGVEGGELCNTADPTTFTIQAVAPTGDKLTRGGNSFEVSVHDESVPNQKNKVPNNLVDNNDGTYTVTYQPVHPGKHVVAVVLHSQSEPMFFEHIAKSPINVEVSAGIDPSKCRVDGPGVTNGQVEDVRPTTFTIHAVDYNGKDIKKGGEVFSVVVTDPKGKPIEKAPTITDNNDGSYAVEYSPIEPGNHTIKIDRKEAPVAKSPYTVDVIAGADEESTSVGTFGFTIQARDRRGEPMTTGGSKVEVIIKLDKSDAPPVEGIEITDHNNGSYSAKYKLEEPGEYLITILLNGRKIKGTPFKQHIVI